MKKDADVFKLFNNTVATFKNTNQLPATPVSKNESYLDEAVNAFIVVMIVFGIIKYFHNHLKKQRKKGSL